MLGRCKEGWALDIDAALRPKRTASRPFLSRAVNQNIVSHPQTCVKIYGLFWRLFHFMTALRAVFLHGCLATLGALAD